MMLTLFSLRNDHPVPERSKYPSAASDNHKPV